MGEIWIFVAGQYNGAKQFDGSMLEYPGFTEVTVHHGRTRSNILEIYDGRFSQI